MITLEYTKAAFANWRATRTNINSPTPQKLWSMVEQLLLKLPRAEVCNTLGISGSQIKKYCAVSKQRSLAGKAQAPKQGSKNDFVAVTQLPVAGSSVELTLRGGTKSLHIRLSTSALQQVLPMLGALL